MYNHLSTPSSSGLLNWVCQRIFILLLLSIATAPLVHAQSIDLKRIKEQTQDQRSVFFYDSLVQQFKTNPANMTLTQAQFLYYGKLFTKGYSTYRIDSEATKAFNKAFNAGQFIEAIPLGEKALETDPVNFEVVAGLHACYARTDQPDKAALREAQVGLFIGAITSSGTGQTIKEGYWVTSISDEYVFFPVMGLEVIKRRGSRDGAKVGITDVWLIKSPESGKEEELYLTVVNVQNSKF